MYLKEIKTQGFKSFADKITLELTKGITGIVGPNGSGKSNVVDAVRWVLGEQSIKSLRGESSMSDIIFSGSNSRKPLNVAYVTLIFDNSDRYLNLESDTVSIKRMVYKDGTNEYYLNNEISRLKDITNLFLDTGVAKESFNIISQGKIEEIISSKPSDRRVIFEEAASVLKYKKRKEEALKKINKTHSNMQRVNDIIEELNNQIGPLKEQNDKALIYNKTMSELKDLEIAFTVTDIKFINEEYQDIKKKIEILNEEISSLDTSNVVSSAKSEELKNKLVKINLDIDNQNKLLLDTTVLLEQLNGRKKIILERQKYNVEDTKLHDNIVNLKEKELNLRHSINSINLDVENINKETDFLKQEKNNLTNVINKNKNDRNNLENELGNHLRHYNKLKIEIEQLKNDIDNNGSLPYAVKNILNNPKLSGIKNTIGNVIEVKEEHSLAISTSLGASANYIITENEQASKEAINYLKNNNIGRATFFPLNVIKPKNIDEFILNQLINMDGFVGIASDLVKTSTEYLNIVKNQLGNVIIVDNLENANQISKNINRRFRIVTLHGDVIHIGGYLTGGVYIKFKNIINDKYELEQKLKEEQQTLDTIKNYENKINEVDYNTKSIEDKYYLINKNIIDFENNLNSKINIQNNYKIDLSNILEEITGTDKIINNSLSNEEETILKEIYRVMDEKLKIENNLNNKHKIKQDQTDELTSYESQIKKDNSEFNFKNKELKDLEIRNNRNDVKLDTLLNLLNETYNLTYEAAFEKYDIVIDKESTKNRISKLKKTIDELGLVNPTAPEEYAKLKERYDFLTNQKNDLEEAENTLLKIIDELDEVMKKDFMETFKIIKENFNKTFIQLFKGGHADLKLTDKDNILETGIEIIASPPGKKLNSISLLSGGEKTLTAISLLFAILQSRPVPFCILDEVEAALDEVNVVNFGEYLKSFQDNTQFILITHKKKTMEFADVLYGITMQESGVSKIVSVKLVDIE